MSKRFIKSPLIDTGGNFVQSPLNYEGGKYKLLPQIRPLFPEGIKTFIDLFGGGCNVAANVKADKIIYNDVNTEVVKILETFKNNSIKDMLSYIDNLIHKYKLSKDNINGYLTLRDDYNNSIEKNPLMLYVMICHSFSNQIRFNSNGKYNAHFGKRTFNPTLQKSLLTSVLLSNIKIYYL